MNQKNVLDVFKERAKMNPKLQIAYIKEKIKHKYACKIRERLNQENQ